MTNTRRGMMGAAGSGASGYKLYTWGKGTNGALGSGSTTSRSTPTQVGTDSDWATLSVIKEAMFATKSNGTMWVWGNGGSGRLGLGNETNYSSPVQLGSLTDWPTEVTSTGFVAVGYDNCSIVKPNGTLWSWGSNNYGALGIGASDGECSPVQVGSLTDWSFHDHNYATGFGLKTDGTLWSWGSGTNGSPGHGNTTTYSSPVQIGSATTWITVRTDVNSGGVVGALKS